MFAVILPQQEGKKDELNIFMFIYFLRNVLIIKFMKRKVDVSTFQFLRRKENAKVKQLRKEPVNIKPSAKFYTSTTSVPPFCMRSVR